MVNRVSSSTIRNFLVIAFAFMLVLVFVIMQQMQRNQREALAELDKHVQFTERATLAQQIESKALNIQRYVLVFRLTPNNRVEQRFKKLYQELLDDLNQLMLIDQNEHRHQLINRMSEHLESYQKSYVSAVISERETSTLINSTIAALVNSVVEDINKLSQIKLSADQALRVENLFNTARLESLAYIAKPSSDRGLNANRALTEARMLVRDERWATAGQRAALNERLTEFEKLFLQIRNQIQNYLYLTNVVMAGTANEFIGLSGELEKSLLAELDIEAQRNRNYLRQSQTRGLILFAVMTVMSLLLAVATFVCIRRLGRVEKSLAKSNESYKSTIDHANVGIAEVAQDGSWIRANKQLCEALGYSEEEFLSGKVPQITHPDDLEEDLAMAHKLVHGEIDQYSIDKRYVRKDGSYFWTRLMVAANRDRKGEFVSFIAVIEDIHEQKKQQSFLQHSNSELKQSVEDRLRDLQRSNAELEQFAYVASHDLQEPLRMIISYMQLVEKRYKDRLDEDGQEFIGYAVDGARRMQALIQSLLEFSRVGTRGEEFKPLDMGEVVSQALRNLSVVIEETGANIRVDKMPSINGDQSQLVRVIQNLLANAINYRSEAPPEIHISASKQTEGWMFSVKDNGIGFDSKYADRIFVIFQRLHSREDYKGTGIGLAVCKKIIERHGGSIWTESEPGKGATFFFTLMN